MINDYRKDLGIHPYLSPFKYYTTDYTNLGSETQAKARRVAKEQAKAHDCSHEGNQIGAYFGGGGDGGPIPMSEQRIAEELFWQWRNSPGHDWTLTLNDGDDWVYVGLCEIWEYVELDFRGVTGIFGMTSFRKDYLPEGVTLPY